MILKTSDFYNALSFFYPLINSLLMPSKKRLKKEIQQLEKGALLEIGVGNGAHLQLYKKHHITAIDTSPKMLNVAKKRNMDSAIFIEMNGEALDFTDSSFDYIVLTHVLSVSKKPNTILAESHRVLKTDGKLFIANHFTPNNALKYVDYICAPFSKIFHFKSLFRLEHLGFLNQFTLHKKIPLGKLGYFKLLVLSKS